MHSQPSGRRLGYAFVIASSLLWSTNGLFSRLIFDSGTLAPRQLAAIRIYGAAVLLAPVVIAARPRLTRSDVLRVLAFGVMGVSLPQWLYFEAIARIPVPIALVIVYLAPVVVTAWERFGQRRHLPAGVYVSIVAALGGVILAVTGGKGGTGALAVSGVLLAFATTFAYAGQITVASIQPAHISPIVRTGLGMIAGSLFWTVLSPWWSLPYGAATSAVSLGPRFSGTVALWLPVLYVIVLGTVVPYTLLVAGAPRIGPSASSVTGMLEPVAAATWAWIALDQRLEPVQVVGIAVALFAVTVAEFLRNRQAMLSIG